MREQQRDFYRIQDQLKMAWRLAADHVVSEADDALIELNQELDEELQSLAQTNPGIASVLTLLNRKIQLAMGDTAASLSDGSAGVGKIFIVNAVIRYPGIN